MRLQTLGRIELDAPGLPALSSRRKELVLLAYLARHSPRAFSRGQAAALLWEDRDDRLARQSLRQALLELRRVVGDGLVVEGDSLRLNAGVVELDATLFERDIAAGRLAQAVARWQGDFLPGTEDAGGEEFRAWLEAEREGLRSRLRSACARLTDEAERRGAWREGIAAVERWVQALPLDQAAQVRLLRLLDLDGQTSDALARLAELEARLRGEALEPSAELAAMRRTLERNAAVAQGRGQASAALRTPDLAGRGAALAELDAAWRVVRPPLRSGQAHSPPGSAVLVEGEPGAGKTRLCEEFLGRVSGGSDPVLVIRLDGTATSPPLLERLADALADAPGLAAAPAAALVSLAGFAPGVRARFPGLPAARELPRTQAVREALAAVADEAPVILMVDDLPQADAEGRGVVLDLMDKPPARVLVLATARTGVAGAGLLPPQGVRRLKLQPLGVNEVDQLVGSMVSLAGDQRRLLATRVHEHTGGFPSHVMEVISGLADQGGLVPDGRGLWRVTESADRLPVPASLRESLERSLAGLSPAARRLLEAAAVLNLPFDRELLGQVTRDSPVAIQSGLEELTARRLVRPGSAAGKLQVATELLRHHLEREVPVARAEQLSSAAVSALERRPADPQQAAGLAYHRARAAQLTAGHRRRRRLALVAGGLACAALAAVLLARPGPATPGEAIAVLPFSVSGAPELGYLREGIVTLLSRELDGVGSVRAVDPRAIVGIAAQFTSGPPDAERGRLIADRAGAGTYVVGDIVQAGDRIRIAATAYGGRPARVLARAQAEGTTSRLFGLVDAVAAQLLGGLSGGPYEQLTRVAATTTQSLQALKSYLEGEQLFRNGAFHPAARAFQRAATEDTTFALAYYWFSVASWWADDSKAIDSAAAQAVRYSGRLIERDRRLFEAWASFLQGDAVEAERSYRRLVGLEPENVEAWLQLGEVLFHSGPRRGQPVGNARPAFERVLFFEPEHTSALLHLARIAASESRWADLDSLARRILRLNATGEWAVEVRALRSFAGHDLPEQARVIEELRTSPEGRVWNTARYVAIAARNLTGAGRIVRLLTEPTRPVEVRAFGHHALAYLDVANGRLAAASRQLDRASALDPMPTMQHRALLALIPGMVPPAPMLSALRDSVAGLILPGAAPTLETSHLANLHDGVGPEIRSYLIASLSLELADGPRAASELRELERPRASPEARALARDAAGSVRGRQAHRAGQWADAARLLAEVLRLEARVGLIGGSPFYSQALERFRYAQVLERLGRHQEAARWYDSFSSNSIFDLAFLPAAELERARMEERLGHRAQAAKGYRRVVELWSGGDAVVQPLVAEARAGLSRNDETALRIDQAAS